MLNIHNIHSTSQRHEKHSEQEREGKKVGRVVATRHNICVTTQSRIFCEIWMLCFWGVSVSLSLSLMLPYIWFWYLLLVFFFASCYFSSTPNMCATHGRPWKFHCEHYFNYAVGVRAMHNKLSGKPSRQDESGARGSCGVRPGTHPVI